MDKCQHKRQRREGVSRKKAWAGAGKKAEGDTEAETKTRNEEDAKAREEAGSDKGGSLV